MAVDPFVVHVARLRRAPGTRWHEIRRGPIDPDAVLAPSTAADSRFPDGAEAVCDAILESFNGGIMARATVSVPWVGVCRRCAIPIAGELVTTVRERFVDPAETPPGMPKDEDTYPMTGDQLDLGSMVREAAVLELPLAPLCRDDCLGLCPHCGIDRNEEQCDCVTPRDPRWANLDVLRSPPQGDRPVEHARRGT